ncbi:mucin-3A [Ochotona princeps]|uniref:mucin-3A n=1 Tax=Ochotona princeps TaxID=9978 RepID=UPI0027150EB9|nr:mucin-3A [Ochotona princeps]
MGSHLSPTTSLATLPSIFPSTSSLPNSNTTFPVHTASATTLGVSTALVNTLSPPASPLSTSGFSSFTNTSSLYTQPISSAPGKTRTLHTTAESPPTPTPTSVITAATPMGPHASSAASTGPGHGTFPTPQATFLGETTLITASEDPAVSFSTETTSTALVPRTSPTAANTAARPTATISEFLTFIPGGILSSREPGTPMSTSTTVPLSPLGTTAPTSHSQATPPVGTTPPSFPTIFTMATASSPSSLETRWMPTAMPPCSLDTNTPERTLTTAIHSSVGAPGSDLPTTPMAPQTSASLTHIMLSFPALPDSRTSPPGGPNSVSTPAWPTSPTKSDASSLATVLAPTSPPATFDNKTYRPPGPTLLSPYSLHTDTPALHSTSSTVTSLSPVPGPPVTALPTQHTSLTATPTASTVSMGPSSLSPFPAPSSSATSLPLSTLLTATPTFSEALLPPTVPQPENTAITTLSPSPTTLWVEREPSAQSTPFSILTSMAKMVTSPSSTTVTPVTPTLMGTSASVTMGPQPSTITSDAPSSEAIPASTWSLPSTTWKSPEPATTPRGSGLPTKPSGSLPAMTMTSSKATQPTLLPARTSETPATPAWTPSSLTSPRTTSSVIQSSPESRLTTLPGTCDNGGTWAQGHCTCLPGFSGDRCQLQQSRCQHGGTWDGLRCICPSTFYGSTCQFPVEQVDVDTVEAVVVMEVSVDQEFTQDLKDNMSKAYRDFSHAFQEQIQEIYREVQEFKGVQILSLRNGSIVVDYLVLLELPFSLQLENQYKEVQNALQEQLQNASQGLDTCHSGQTLCFKPDSAKVHASTPMELTPEALCRRAAAQGYEEFYFPVVDRNRLRCVTRCTVGVDGALDCHQGLCLLQRNGPTCRCFSSDTHWVWGPRCEAAVHWRALVGCLAGAALLLLLLLLLLGMLVAHARRRRSSRQDRHWDQDRKWGESWDEDIVGIFCNMGLQGPRAVEEENCCVALEMVDHNVRVRG